MPSSFHYTPSLNLASVTYAALALIISLPTYANILMDDDTLLTEEDLFSDIPEVTSATRLTQKLTDAPASITIVTREQIEASAVVEVFDLFRMVPGMQVIQPTKNKGAVTYHGMSHYFPNRMEIMVDGRSIYLPLLSTVAWETLGLTIDDVERIEVVRGSNVPSQGSNAFSGAINIITRSHSHQSGEVNVMAGSGQEKRTSIRHGLDTERGFIDLSAGYKSNHPDSLFEDAMINRYFNLQGLESLNPSTDIHYGFGLSSGYSVIGEGDELDNIFEPRDHDSNHQYFTLEHTTHDSDRYKLSFSHYYLDLALEEMSVEQYIIEDQHVDSATASAYAQALGLDGSYIYRSGEHGTSDVYNLEVQKSANHTEALKSVVGLGYKYDRALSVPLLDRDDWIGIHKGSLFGNLEWLPNRYITVNSGAMLEATDNILPRLSPRIAINYKPDDNSSIRTALTRAYRMPSVLESYSQTSIRQNADNDYEIYDQVAGHTGHLKPERIDSFELGYFSNIDAISGHFDLRLFYDHVTDGINSHFVEANPDYPDQNNYRFVQDNIMSWYSSGLEFQVSTRPTFDSLVLFNYNFTDLNGNYQRYSHTNVELDTYVPSHTASALYNLSFGNNWDWSLNYYFMSSANWFEGSANELIPNYQRLDSQLRKAFTLGSDVDADLRLVVQNLFDDSYPDFYKYNIFEQRLYLELRMHY